jgi:hypothetical protein
LRNGGRDMANLRLKAIVHNRFGHPVNPAWAPLDNVFSALAATVACNVQRIRKSCPDIDDPICGTIHVLSSTIVNMCFTVGDFDWRKFQAMIATRTSTAPKFFLSAYECAGWGYSLRHWTRNFPGSQYFMVTILDANLYDFEFWVYNSNWEKSGFGCTTLLFEKTGSVSEELVVGSVRGNNALMEFALAVSRAARRNAESVVALPFFPQRVFETLSKSLTSVKLLPNWHAEWGHCFGSDPWLAILKSWSDGERKSSFLACSLALNGYFCIVKVVMDAELAISVSKAPLTMDEGAIECEVSTSGSARSTESADRTEVTAIERWHGTLTSRPFGDRAVLAQMQSLPLIGEHDFAVAASFPGARATPVFLSYAEHLEFLSLLVRELFARIPELQIVIRMRLPIQGRLPVELLDEKVLLLDDLTGDVGCLSIQNNVLEIEDRFVRHPLEAGDNRIQLRLVAKVVSQHLGNLAPWLQHFWIREIERAPGGLIYDRS